VCASVYPSVSVMLRQERERERGALGYLRDAHAGSVGREEGSRPAVLLAPSLLIPPLFRTTHMHSLFLFSYLSLSLSVLSGVKHRPAESAPLFCSRCGGYMYVLIPISLFGSSELAAKSGSCPALSIAFTCCKLRPRT
jgi:hypothetical protein